MSDQIGRVLGGRYRLIAPIGAGASAQVYLADDVRLRRRVAVKVLHAGLAEDESFLRRFRAEAQAAAALSHPNIVAVFDWGEDELPFIVTEYLGGGSLRAMLDSGERLTSSQALMVGLEATRALEHAHRRGFVHRDIKPANLLFGEEGRLRIADFGLARALAEAAWTEPAGAMLGTARYASPEQAKGEKVDGKGDVYSLGLVLTEAVTGVVPFTADTTIATLMARIDRQVEVPAELGPLRRPLERAGRPDPADRPDAGELAVSLMAAAEELDRPEPLPLAGAVPLDDAPVDVSQDATQLVATGDGTALFDVDTIPADGASLAGGGRRRWPVVALTILLALVLGGAAAYAVVQARVPSHTVPDIVGRQKADALNQLSGLGFKIEEKEDRKDGSAPGEVLHTDPIAGKSLKEGRTLTLFVSLGNKLTPVPNDLVGKPEADARAALEAAGLVAEVKPEPSETVAAGTVLAVPAGLPGQLPKGDKVILTISSGPAPRIVPEGLAGLTYDQAATKLAEVQLGAKKTDAFSDDVPAGTVIGTKPAAGEPAARDSAVEIVVSKGPDVVVVPNVNGKSYDEAIAAIEGAGLVVDQVFGQAKGRPFATDPPAGSTVKRGSKVNIFLRR
jgi:serine/threonine-protein kinase